MEQLYSIGLNNQEIVNMLEVNQEIRNVTNEEIKGLCDLLRFIGCKDYHVKNILIANPFYLTRSVEDVQKLIQKLESLGIVHLETTFDSNPWLFNKDAFEIDEYIEERMSAGVSLEEVIDEIDAGTLF